MAKIDWEKKRQSDMGREAAAIQAEAEYLAERARRRDAKSTSVIDLFEAARKAAAREENLAFSRRTAPGQGMRRLPPGETEEA